MHLRAEIFGWRFDYFVLWLGTRTMSLPHRLVTEGYGSALGTQLGRALADLRYGMAQRITTKFLLDIEACPPSSVFCEFCDSRKI